MNKILIVDASASDNRVMSGLLTKAGYDSVVAESIEARKTEAAELPPGAVIVTAMRLPDGTARELINWLKAEDYKFPVLAIVENLNTTDAVDVMRGGPGLGTIQPSQSDYFQATKGGGHGDYHLIVLAPASVQEMSDFVVLGFELAFKYRNPAMVLADGVIGQMMEKVVLPDYTPRWTDEEIEKISGDWALTGKKKNRNHHIITSLELEAHRQEVFNEKLQRKYREIEANEVRYEALNCEDADYIFVAYGSCARICQKSIQLARQEGIKVGLLRPITLYPFPTEAISDLCAKTKGFLSIEMSAGQMVEDVRLAVNGRVKVDFYGRMGGVVPTPEEIVEALKNKFKI